MAAAIATGTSTLSGLHFLDRGYEDVVGKLQSIGLDIERVRLDIKEKVIAVKKKPVAAPALKIIESCT